MQKNKKISGVEYTETPEGIVLPWKNATPTDILVKSGKIPKREKKALIPDFMDDSYRWLIDDTMGYLKHRMKTDLIYLCNRGLGFYDITPHIWYQRQLGILLNCGKQRILIIIPRWHFKTTFIIGKIIQDLLNDPNETTIIVSNTFTNAAQILDVVAKRILGREIQLVFGNLRGNRWSRSEIDIANRTEWTREASVYIAGVGSDVTGQHPNKGIIDDIVSKENSETVDGRRKVKDFYEYLMFVVTRQVIAPGTRWDFNDLWGDLIVKNQDLPATHPMKYAKLVLGVYDQYGEPLFPLTYRDPTNPKPMYDRDWIESKRVEMGAYKFSCQMLNQPIPSENAVFTNDMLEDYYYDVIPPGKLKQLKKYILVDPASGEEKYTDKTAIVVMGVDDDLDMYILEYVNKRMEIHDSISAIWKLACKWKPRKIGIEQGTLEKAFRKPLKDRMRIHNRFFKLRKLKYGEQPGSRGRSKAARIDAFATYVEAGCLRIGRWMTEFQECFLNYRPFGSYPDDIPDATSYSLQVIEGAKSKSKSLEDKTTFLQRALRARRGRGGKNWEHKFLNEGVT